MKIDKYCRVCNCDASVNKPEIDEMVFMNSRRDPDPLLEELEKGNLIKFEFPDGFTRLARVIEVDKIEHPAVGETEYKLKIELVDHLPRC